MKNNLRISNALRFDLDPQTVKEIFKIFLEELIDSILSRRLLAFYTWMNRVTECLYEIV